jgi:hypothetical protein
VAHGAEPPPGPARSGGEADPAREDIMVMRNGLLVLVGTVATVAGIVFALQGFNVIGGSAMSGHSLWAVLGPVIAVVGLALLAAGSRRRGIAARRR